MTVNYVNNKEFSAAVSDYAISVAAAKENGIEPPQVTDYIATSLLKIATGLSRLPNFSGYSYRDDMIMDAVENCIKVVRNYNINATTRSGTPNAFGYFTLICYRAFIRRIHVEKKQTKIKNALISSGSLSDYIDDHTDDGHSNFGVGENIVEKIRNRMDSEDRAFDPEPKKAARRGRKKAQKPVPRLDEFM